MDVIGLVLVGVFYGLILIAGLWIARTKGAFHPETSKDLMVAGRSLGLFVGILTLVATEVGGAFVNGTAEETFNRGILWCLAPIGYSLSMSINGLFFVKKLREAQCVTLVDIMQKVYGDTVGGLIYLPSCIGDVCWTAAVLSALGGTLAVILKVEKYITLCVCVSAAVTIGYTLIGGMYSVAYTDVVQMILVLIGLWLAVPFVALETDLKTLPGPEWTGSITKAI